MRQQESGWGILLNPILTIGGKVQQLIIIAGKLSGLQGSEIVVNMTGFGVESVFSASKLPISYRPPKGFGLVADGGNGVIYLVRPRRRLPQFVCDSS